MNKAKQPVVVTGAPRSRDDEFKARKRRYAIMMLTRALLLCAAFGIAFWSIWAAGVIAILSAIIPWLAVLMANDGPPKKSSTFRALHPGDLDRQLESSVGPVSGVPVIDAEPDLAQAPKET